MEPRLRGVFLKSSGNLRLPVLAFPTIPSLTSMRPSYRLVRVYPIRSEVHHHNDSVHASDETLSGSRNFWPAIHVTLNPHLLFIDFLPFRPFNFGTSKSSEGTWSAGLGRRRLVDNTKTRPATRTYQIVQTWQIVPPSPRGLCLTHILASVFCYDTAATWPSDR